LWFIWLKLLTLPQPGPLVYTFFFLHEFLHEGNKVVRLGWRHINFLDALWIWPIFDLDHGASLLSRLESELLCLAIDVEAAFSSSNINLHSSSA
jgi:hypothetical protein